MTLIAEFIDANELGLALEQIADVLSEDEQPLAPDERADMLVLVKRMQMGDRLGVLRATDEVGLKYWRSTEPPSSDN